MYVNYLQKVNSIYYFRRKVPKNINSILQKKEIKMSLRTKYFKLARSLVNMYIKETELLFFNLSMYMLSEKDMNKLVSDYYFKLKLIMEKEGLAASSGFRQKAEYEGIAQGYAREHGEVYDYFMDKICNPIDGYFDEWMKKYSIDVTEDSLEYCKLREKITEASSDTAKIGLSRFQRDDSSNRFEKKYLLEQNKLIISKLELFI